MRAPSATVLLAVSFLATPLNLLADFVMKCDYVVDSWPGGGRVFVASPTHCAGYPPETPTRLAVTTHACPPGYRGVGELEFSVLATAAVKEGNRVIERQFREARRTCTAATVQEPAKSKSK